MRRIYILEQADNGRWFLVCGDLSRIAKVARFLRIFRMESARIGTDFHYVKIWFR
jgi:hypothetical protein